MRAGPSNRQIGSEHSQTHSASLGHRMAHETWRWVCLCAGGGRDGSGDGRSSEGPRRPAVGCESRGGRDAGPGMMDLGWTRRWIKNFNTRLATQAVRVTRSSFMRQAIQQTRQHHARSRRAGHGTNRERTMCLVRLRISPHCIHRHSSGSSMGAPSPHGHIAPIRHSDDVLTRSRPVFRAHAPSETIITGEFGRGCRSFGRECLLATGDGIHVDGPGRVAPFER